MPAFFVPYHWYAFMGQNHAEPKYPAFHSSRPSIDGSIGAMRPGRLWPISWISPRDWLPQRGEGCWGILCCGTRATSERLGTQTVLSIEQHFKQLRATLGRFAAKDS